MSSVVFVLIDRFLVYFANSNSSKSCHSSLSHSVRFCDIIFMRKAIKEKKRKRQRKRKPVQQKDETYLNMWSRRDQQLPHHHHHFSTYLKQLKNTSIRDQRISNLVSGRNDNLLFGVGATNCGFSGLLFLDLIWRLLRFSCICYALLWGIP